MRCPACEKQFRTRQGTRQHHTKVHGDPLPNRTCIGCGTEFYDPKSRRKFCDDCNPNGGRHNGNWKGAKEEGECRTCGAAFEYYPSNKPGVYCQACVEGATEFLGTPYHEVHDIQRVLRECEQCGDEMELLQSYVDYDPGFGRFCSHECRCLAMMESNERVTYNEGWAAARRQALERDDQTCQKCGISRSALDHDLDVHHIVPVREVDEPSQAHYLGNLVCLCRSCHMAAEWKLRSIQNRRS